MNVVDDRATAPAGAFADADAAHAQRLRPWLEALYGAGPAAGDLADRLAGAAAAARRARAVRPAGARRPRRGAQAVLLAYPHHVDAGAPAPLAGLARFCDAHADAFAAVHVLPFFPADGDFGFAVTDHRQVDPALGSTTHVQAVADRFALCADLVLHHVSAAHPWVADHLHGRLPFAPFVAEPAHGASTPFARGDGRTVRLATRYGPGQVDLDFRVPQVLEDVAQTLLWLVGLGARWIRLDAIAFTWPHDDGGTHGERVRTLVRVLSSLAHGAHPDTRLVAEADLATRGDTYLEAGGTMAQATYDLALPALLAEAAISGDARALAGHLRHRPAPPAGTTCLNPVATHDGLFLRPYAPILAPARLDTLLRRTRERGGHVRLREVDGVTAPYECNIALATLLEMPGEPPPASAQRLHGLVALVAALQGLPLLYLNVLLAAADDRAAVLRTGDPRAVNRRVYGAAELGALLGAETPAAWLWPRVRHTLATAADVPALSPQAPQRVLDTGRPALLAVQRGEDALLCVANLSGDAQPWTLPPGHFRDVLTGHRAQGDVTLQAHDTWWLEPAAPPRNRRAPPRSVRLAEDSRAFYRDRALALVPGGGLVLDPSYRRNHLPLVRPGHPDVVATCPETDYRRGSYRRPRVSLVAFFADDCLRGAAWDACLHDLRRAPFAGKIDWRTHAIRRHRLHATLCGNLQLRHDDAAIERIAQAAGREPAFAVRALGPWIGAGRNNGRMYLPLLQERRAGDASLPTHRLQALAGLAPTDLLVLGLFQFTDHLDDAEARALAAVLERHRDATLFERVVDEVALIATHDDLILNSRVLRRIELQEPARPPTGPP